LEERSELKRLFGQCGTDIDDPLGENWTGDTESVRERQIYWRVKKERARVRSAREIVAESAETRYGLKLGQLRDSSRNLTVPTRPIHISGREEPLFPRL
jgi:hypothetical protein